MENKRETKLKPLEEQVLVITGASSGIGLATAKMAAERGARVVLCSRNLPELESICREIKDRGGRAIPVECDVSDPSSVERVADAAFREFGGIDTWVNNAGLSIYGKLWEVPIDEKRRLFDVNFWGVVYGCRTAVKAMRASGGTIINIGSILSERALPIQGIYSASKHAVKAYTDVLRMELEAEGWPISVSLIKPGAIDTPFPEHAVNKMAHHPVHTPPVYAPEIVAEAIIDCAIHPRRDVFIGGSAKLYSLLEAFLPRLTDLFMERKTMEGNQSSERLDRVPQDPALKRVPVREGRVRGHYPDRVKESSLYTKSALHPGLATLFIAGAGLAAIAGYGAWQMRSGSKPKLFESGERLTH